MKKSLFLILVFCVTIAAGAQSLTLRPDNVDQIVKALTLDEKVSLVVGAGNTVFTGYGNTLKHVPGAAGSTAAIERLGVTPTVVADGPAGLRISPRREGSGQTYYCTGFPVATSLASSWDLSLMYSIGEVMGNEVLEYGVDVLLAPGMNLHRDPLCGRNFEYYSEDPLLSGKMAASFSNGVQSNGVGVSLKHFAVNNQETNRKDVDVRIGARALRELYLRSFEIAVKESHPLTVMSAYNMINGQQCMESRDLLTTILRDEWGFDGIVMCDWASPGWRKSAVEIYAGNDLLTPGSQIQRQEIIDAVNTGELDEKDLDVCVKRILEYVVRTPRYKGYKYSDKPDLAAHAQVARAAATEGMVLLKNDAGTLPFQSADKSVGLFGITSYDFIAGGTGSGNVNRAYVISLLEGLENAGVRVNADVKARYEDMKAKLLSAQTSSGPLGRAALSEIQMDRALVRASADQDDLALITIGRNAGEGADRHLQNDFLLSTAETSLIRSVCEEFHARGKRVVVILNINGVVETASWKDLPDAILLAWLPGQEGGNAVMDILRGASNPSGKLTSTFPVSYFDTNTYDNFPYDYTGALAMGNYPKIPRPERKNIHYVNYDEDIYVGYRYYVSEGKTVSYPFGYGLSYTDFSYGTPSVKQAGDTYTVSVKVTNTGKVAGKEAVQLYYRTPDAKVERPLRQLVSFGKTRLLAPGESQTLTLEFKEKDLAWFDTSRMAWVLEPTRYVLEVAASSVDVRGETSVAVSSEKVLEKVHNVLKRQ